jgi:hypothetical protein
MPLSIYPKEVRLIRILCSLAGLVFFTSFCGALYDQFAPSGPSFPALPRLEDGPDSIVILETYHQRRREIEGNRTLLEGTRIHQKRSAAENLFRSLDNSASEALRTAITQHEVEVVRVADVRSSLRFVLAALIALLFLVVPLLYRGWNLSLGIPGVCSLLAFFSVEHASRAALLGAIVATLLLLAGKLIRDQRDVRFTRPSWLKLVTAMLVALIPVCAYGFIAVRVGAWIDTKIDEMIDRTETITSGAVVSAGEQFRESTAKLRAPWYDPREVFVFKPIRETAMKHTGSATLAISNSTRLFYVGLRACLQISRFLTTLTILWAAGRFALLILGKAFLHAGGSIEFGLFPSIPSRARDADTDIA